MRSVKCCSGASSCSGGVPSACDAECARVFMPFWSQCDSFVRANLPELVSFGGKCERHIGSTAVPPPPPVAGGETYLQVTLSMQPGSVGTGKAQKRFLSSLRSDIGQALDIVPSAILVDNVQGDSVTV